MDILLELPTQRVEDLAIKQWADESRARGKDMRPAWDNLIDMLYLHERMLFASEGATSETPRWEPLSDNPREFKGRTLPGYATWKLQHYPGTKILELTQRLKDQLSGNNATAFIRRGVRRLNFGSNYPLPGGAGDLGGIHAEGRTTPNVMPARPPIIVTESLMQDLADLALDYITDAPGRP